MALRIRSMVRARNYPRPKTQSILPRNVATPQQLAGSTVSQTTTDPKHVRFAPGIALQYDSNGKPIGFVRINQSNGTTSNVGIGQGKGISYDASGKPSLVDWPPKAGSSAGSTPSGGIGPNERRDLNPGAFGDWAYNQTSAGILGSVDTSVSGQNFNDQQYLMQMGYTPEQAKAAIQSRQYGILDPANPQDPTKTINRDVGSLQAGALDWNQVDASNPYSRAGMLVKSYRGAVQGTSTGMAAGGHGRSGAALTAQQANSTNFGAGQAQWNQDLTGYQSTSNANRLGIGYNANQGILQAAADYMGRAPAVPLTEMPASWSEDTSLAAQADKNQPSVSNVPATGNYIYGADEAKRAGLLAPGIKLGNGWSIEVKDGKVVRFIPPGGK